jgi:hypothetical protein
MHRRTLALLLITPLWTGCAAREATSPDRDAAAASAPSTTGAAQSATPAGEIARPPPPPIDSPADTPAGSASGTAGVRAPPQNDAPPRPSGPARPLQPAPTLDSKRTAPVPPLDRSQTPVQVPPLGPVNEKPSSADR